MKLVRIKEIFKVAIASVAAVSLFGGALFGANCLSLRAATNDVSIVPPALEYVNIPANIMAIGFQTPDVNLSVIPTMEVSPNALTPEETLNIGARYLLDVFNANITGMYVELFYLPLHLEGGLNRPQWFGAVSNELRPHLAIEATEAVPTLAYINADFYFLIDAITGERIDIRRTHFEIDWASEQVDAYSIVMRDFFLAEIAQFEFEDGAVSEINLGRLDLAPQQIQSLMQIAEEYAQRHFNNSTVVEVEFIVAIALLFDVDVNGEIDTRVSIARINVTDDTERVATVTINLEAEEVTGIATSHNDVAHLW